MLDLLVCSSLSFDWIKDHIETGLQRHDGDGSQRLVVACFFPSSLFAHEEFWIVPIICLELLENELRILLHDGIGRGDDRCGLHCGYE